MKVSVMLFTGIDIISGTVDNVKRCENLATSPLQYVLGIDNRTYTSSVRFIICFDCTGFSGVWKIWKSWRSQEILPLFLFLLFFPIHFEYLLQLHATYYTTYSLLNSTTRTIPRSARCHDNSVAINMNNW